MDLESLQRTLRQFAAERGWDELNTPKNLSTALMVEAAELAEIFQWMSPEESWRTHGDALLHEAVADEVADVLIYLVQLADRSRVDLQAAVARKLEKNARKHRPRPDALPATPRGEDLQTIVLIDYENVHPDENRLRELVRGVTDVWLFHGPDQRDAARRYASFGERLRVVPVERRGDNALDFRLTFYLGYLMAHKPTARFVVLSNDRDYSPVIEHAQAKDRDVQQVGDRSVPAVPKKAPPKAAPAKKVAAKKTAAPAKPTAARVGAKALTALRKMKAALPARRAALEAHVVNMVPKGSDVAPASVIDWLRSKGHVTLKPDGSVVYKL